MKTGCGVPRWHGLMPVKVYHWAHTLKKFFRKFWAHNTLVSFSGWVDQLPTQKYHKFNLFICQHTVYWNIAESGYYGNITAEALIVGTCVAPCRPCYRAKGKLNRPWQLMKDAACCLSLSTCTDLEGEGKKNLEVGYMYFPQLQEIDMLGYTQPCLCPLLHYPLCTAHTLSVATIWQYIMRLQCSSFAIIVSVVPIAKG